MTLDSAARKVRWPLSGNADRGDAAVLHAGERHGVVHRGEARLAGIQQLAHDTNLLFYASEEAQEGREAYKAKRKPDFSQFPKRP